MDKPSMELQAAARALKMDVLAEMPAGDDGLKDGNAAERIVAAALRRLVIFAPESPCDHATLIRHQREEIGKLASAHRALAHELAWMHDCKALSAFWGRNLAQIANILIDRRYPGLRAGASTDRIED